MAPELLIVGDATRRADLLQRVLRLGYDASVCTQAMLDQRAARGEVPGAVLVCIEDADPRPLMAALRSTRRGSGVPVTLYGPLSGTTGDLADVLDLGADHFLEAPAAEESLVAALEELLGPGAPPAGATRSGRREGPAAAEATRGRSGATDVVLGQLHRTLDMLEARLREREGEGLEADDLDLDELGLPPVQDDREARASGTRGSSLELPLAHTEAAPAPPRSARGRREPTERLGERLDEGTGSPPVGTSAAGSEVAPAPSDDRPRRHAPLPIEDRGALDRVEVPRLLWTLHRARYTGALSLEHGPVAQRQWWQDGDLVSVRSTQGPGRFLDGLLRRGLLTRDQYETAQPLAAKDPHRAGAALVEAGLLEASELGRVLREHLMHIVDSTFPWTEGHWQLTPGERSEETALVDTPVPLLVAEGVRHRMESAQLTVRLGGLGPYPRVRSDAMVLGGPRTLAERLQMSPSEHAWLERLDGAASLRELLARPGTDALELLGLVYVLHVLDHLELRDHGIVAAAHADPMARDVARIRDRLQLAREGDYFAALGVPRDAERLEVRRAHGELHRTFADAHLEPSVRVELRAELEELRDLLDEARDVLADDGLRSAYLAHLEDP